MNSDQAWKTLLVLPGTSLGLNRMRWTVHIGRTQFQCEQRRRARGTYIDNSFATWYETWVSQDGVDLGYLDTTRYPPPQWDVTDGAEHWVGVRGRVLDQDVLVSKPYRVGLQRRRLIGIALADRRFTLNAKGEVVENGSVVARIGAGPDRGVLSAADDSLWVLAILLNQAGVPQAFEADVHWEMLLDPTLLLEFAAGFFTT